MGTNSKIIKIFSYLFLIGILTAILLLHFSFDGREAKILYSKAIKWQILPDTITFESIVADLKSA